MLGGGEGIAMLLGKDKISDSVITHGISYQLVCIWGACIRKRLKVLVYLNSEVSFSARALEGHIQDGET